MSNNFNGYEMVISWREGSFHSNTTMYLHVPTEDYPDMAKYYYEGYEAQQEEFMKQVKKIAKSEPYDFRVTMYATNNDYVKTKEYESFSWYKRYDNNYEYRTQNRHNGNMDEYIDQDTGKPKQFTQSDMFKIMDRDFKHIISMLKDYCWKYAAKSA